MVEEYKNTLLISANELKSETMISGNVDEKILGNVIDTAQTLYLAKITGTPLVNRLKELVYNKIKGLPDNISDQANEKYAELLENYVKPFLKAQAQKDSLVPLSMKIKNAGVVQLSDTNVNKVDLDYIKYLERHYSTLCDDMAQKLSKYLCFYKSDFPELNGTIASYNDSPSLGKEYAPTGLWLGGRKNKGCGTCK